MKNPFFVTGALRSGTTLLEKLLCNHPQLSTLAQPFQLVFINIKRLMHAQFNHPEMHYVLNHYCGETRYSLEELEDYLSGLLLSKDQSKQLVGDAVEAGFSGQLTDIDLSRLDALGEEMSFAKFYHELMTIYRHRADCSWVGSKEVLCEEFIFYFLNQDIPCLQIIRDPRDMVSSIYFGKGEIFIGSPIPLLYTLHNWRKSVQIALVCKNRKGFYFLRYEDLVQEELLKLNEIASMMKIEEFTKEMFTNGILNQQGQLWKSNSSFVSGTLVSTDSIGRYKEGLPENLIEYINCVCYPELKALGYDVNLPENPEKLIKQFREPFTIERDGIMESYSTNPVRIAFEIERVKNFHPGSCILNQAYEELLKFS